MKNTVIFILILAVLVGAFIWFGDDTPVSVAPTPTPSTGGTVDLCYIYSEKTSRGFFDRAWVKLAIKGGDVSGEFYNLPAEKDSKVGEFEGTVGPMDPKISGRHAEVIWNTLAEGMQNKEELSIQFGEGSAVAFFGEMVDGGNGVYVYKDKTNLFPSNTMSQIDCGALLELKAIEKYVRENISTIASDKAVLGGTFYVVTIDVNPQVNSGEVVYEDGHIQSRAKFTYTFDTATDTATIVNFSKI